MNSNLYIARQPILDKYDNIFAYELLYRDSNQSSNIKNDRHATVTVLSNVLNKFGVKNLLGDNKAFIKADKKFLMHDVVFYIPKEHFIFAIQANMEITEALEQRIIKLSEMGYLLAINDVLLTKETLDKFSKLLKYITYIKVDVNTPSENLDLLQSSDLVVIFTKVETHDMYDKAKKFNGNYVQGYFFSKPKILEQEKFDPNSLTAINLCNYIMSDSSIDEIVEKFEENHAISLQLLKYVNSGSFHFRQNISSVRQILTLMGRTPLTQWLMLMVYSTNGTLNEQESESPLMQLLKCRTNLMVEVSKQIQDSGVKDLSSKVYFVGVISLLDTLFNVNINTILEELNIDSEIKEAINGGEGVLGDIYMFAKNLEKFDIKAVENFCDKYDIETEELEKLTFEVIQSANEFENSRSA
ncbi:diguanylate phosphodiesterase [Sulfurimonas gotlandica GD1]|uniref:Diguanylate phosphodiesterase n=1 Tax=Sulfurimonas gotlandica (strain DSM 19862 / JCM 16533 / GD1) TaxID=929558 RepID=B6BJJ2_SULGG|nr:HDOD domain-containing protein [Sulfurimonas gotlandica]EDZ62634.1 diguanylate phosphodiesterase, putative [Sulfurimonas gotlandica GD1]EHP31237.1 diguanylate phosphodiesterase [Sulfurimonas gotlandica GD1]